MSSFVALSIRIRQDSVWLTPVPPRNAVVQPAHSGENHISQVSVSRSRHVVGWPQGAQAPSEGHRDRGRGRSLCALSPPGCSPSSWRHRSLPTASSWTPFTSQWTLRPSGPFDCLVPEHLRGADPRTVHVVRDLASTDPRTSHALSAVGCEPTYFNRNRVLAQFISS